MLNSLTQLEKRRLITIILAINSKAYDPEKGTYHYRVRDYDPKTGRFLQKDPIGWTCPDFADIIIKLKQLDYGRKTRIMECVFEAVTLTICVLPQRADCGQYQ